MTKRRGLFRSIAHVSILAIALTDVGTGTVAAASAATAATPGAALAVSSLGTAPGSAATLGVITGVVRGISGGLSGVCVTATGPGGTVPALTRTGGRYVITGLRTGEYTLGYSDCAHPARYFDQWYGDSDVAATAAKVLVTPGQPVRLAAVTLRPTNPLAAMTATRSAASSVAPAVDFNSVSGTVRSRSGKRLAGICVYADTTSSSGDISGVEDLTGSRGGYHTTIGDAGKWAVLFTVGCGSSGNYAPQWWRYDSTRKKATLLRARHGHHHFRGIDARLRAGAEFSGVVRAAGGTRKPLSGVCVAVAGLGWMRDIQAQVVTRANGSYLVPSLGTGRYNVTFAPDCGQPGNYLSTSYRHSLSVTDGRTTTGINAALATGGTISGLVTSQAGGAPVDGICVGLESGEALRMHASGKDGSYSFGRLRPGRYGIGFAGGCGNAGSYAPQFYDAQPSVLGGTPVTISAGQLRSGIDAAMLPGGTVSGQVTTTAGPGLHDACVILLAPDLTNSLSEELLETRQQNLLNDAGGIYVGATGKTGSYRLTNLPPGRYSAQFGASCEGRTHGYAPQQFDPQGGSGPTWVSVNPGTITAGVSAVLRQGGTISGLVTGTGGRPLSGVCVLATSTTSAITPVFSLLSAPATHHGVYQITSLPTGRYNVSFTPCDGQPYAAQWYQGKASQASARRILVRDGHATTHINAALTSGGTISGRILSGISGKPVADVCVLVLDSAGNVVNAVVSRKSGSYRLPHLAAGRWTVEPQPCQSASPKLAGIVRRGIRVKNAATTTVGATLPKAGRIAGTVLAGAAAAGEPGICVQATPLSGGGQPGFALTGAHGRYTMPGLLAGSYRVLFTPFCDFGTAAVVPQWFNGQPARGTATTVTVTPGQTTANVGGTLAADGGISGTVRSATDAPVAGVCVGAYAGTAATPAVLASTGSDGGYQLGTLLPGSYRIKFSSGCGATSYATGWYDNASSRSTATRVTVTAGIITTGVDAG